MPCQYNSIHKNLFFSYTRFYLFKLFPYNSITTLIFLRPVILFILFSSGRKNGYIHYNTCTHGINYKDTFRDFAQIKSSGVGNNIMLS